MSYEVKIVQNWRGSFSDNFETAESTLSTYTFDSGIIDLDYDAEKIASWDYLKTEPRRAFIEFDSNDDLMQKFLYRNEDEEIHYEVGTGDNEEKIFSGFSKYVVKIYEDGILRYTGFVNKAETIFNYFSIKIQLYDVIKIVSEVSDKILYKVGGIYAPPIYINLLNTFNSLVDFIKSGLEINIDVAYSLGEALQNEVVPSIGYSTLLFNVQQSDEQEFLSWFKRHLEAAFDETGIPYEIPVLLIAGSNKYSFENKDSVDNMVYSELIDILLDIFSEQYLVITSDYDYVDTYFLFRIEREGGYNKAYQFHKSIQVTGITSFIATYNNNYELSGGSFFHPEFLNDLEKVEISREYYNSGVIVENEKLYDISSNSKVTVGTADQVFVGHALKRYVYSLGEQLFTQSYIFGYNGESITYKEALKLALFMNNLTLSSTSDGDLSVNNIGALDYDNVISIDKNDLYDFKLNGSPSVSERERITEYLDSFYLGNTSDSIDEIISQQDIIKNYYSSLLNSTIPVKAQMTIEKNDYAIQNSDTLSFEGNYYYIIESKLQNGFYEISGYLFNPNSQGGGR